MKQGFSQPIAGRAPSVGANPYLTRSDFLTMLGIAFVVHAVFFIILDLLPHEHVHNIPVRALSFKLGDQEPIAATSTAAAHDPAAAPALQAFAQPSDDPNAPPTVSPKPIAKPKPVEAKPVKQPKIYHVTDPEPRPAIAPTPQQYVRETGAPSPQAVDAALARATQDAGAGNDTSANAQAAQAIRARYEQQISAWIQQHKYYPQGADGHMGRAVVRMRIDRAGNVRYYAIEQSTGVGPLDAAALEMVRRANPLPAVPENYPAGNLIEFLIPISFKAP